MNKKIAKIDISDLYDDMKAIADKHNITVDQLIRKFFKLGMVAAWIEDNNNAVLIVEDGNGQRELTIFDNKG